MRLSTLCMLLGSLLAGNQALAVETPGNSDYDYCAVSDSAGSCDTCGADADCCCDTGCDCCNNKLLGFIAPSAGCFEDFISPMTNPLYFEDPRNLSEIRFIFAQHDVPNKVLNGGEVQYLAAHIRVALTERLSVIAVKDGFL